MRSYVPSFCQLSDDCLRLMCSVNLFDIDTIGFGLKIHHCTSPMNIVVYANDSDIGLTWSHEFDAKGAVGIPDLSIDVPGLGSAGVFVAVELGGTSTDAFIAVGLEACLTIGKDEQALVRTKKLRQAGRFSHAAHPAVLAAYGLEHPAVAYVPGVGTVDFTKCEPDPPITIIKQSIDFSGVPCDDDGGHAQTDDQTKTNDVPYWDDNAQPSPAPTTNDNNNAPW